MVKIRLQRLGAKKRPYYRLIAIDERARRDGRPLEYLGTYDPVGKREELQVDVARVDAWLAQGAQMSDRAAALVRRVRRRPPAVAATAAARPAVVPPPEAAASEATAPETTVGT